MQSITLCISKGFNFHLFKLWGWQTFQNGFHVLNQTVSKVTGHLLDQISTIMETINVCIHPRSLLLLSSHLPSTCSCPLSPQSSNTIGFSCYESPCAHCVWLEEFFYQAEIYTFLSDHRLENKSHLNVSCSVLTSRRLWKMTLYEKYKGLLLYLVIYQILGSIWFSGIIPIRESWVSKLSLKD